MAETDNTKMGKTEMDKVTKPTFAKVKFIEDKCKKTIPIDDIVELKENPPKDFKDYDSSKIYTCLYKDDKYPELTKYGVQIGELCEKESDSPNSKKRAIFKQLSGSTVDEYYKAQEEEADEKDVDDRIRKKKIKKESAKIDKKQQQDVIKKKIDNLINTPLLVLHKCITQTKSDQNEESNKEYNINMLKESDTQHLKFEIIRLKTENEKLYNKFESLKCKYEEQQLRLDNYVIFNEKLQSLLFKKDVTKIPVVSEKNESLTATENEDNGSNSLKCEEDKWLKNLSLTNDFEDKNNVHFRGIPSSSPVLDRTPKTSRKRKRVIDIESDDDSSGKEPVKQDAKSSKDDEQTSEESERKLLEKFIDLKTNEKMVYIKHGFTISNSKWKQILASKTQSRFCKALLNHFYDRNDLVNYCIKEGENVRTPNGVNKRKVITPKKSDAIGTLLEYYIRKFSNVTDKKEIQSLVEKRNHYFSEEILKYIKEYKKSINKELTAEKEASKMPQK